MGEREALKKAEDTFLTTRREFLCEDKKFEEKLHFRIRT